MDSGAAGRRAAGIAPMLRIAAGALQHLGAQYLPLHKATAKLGYVASSLFVGLLEEGFCTAEDSAEEAVGGEGGTFKEAEGTVSLRGFVMRNIPKLCLHASQREVSWHVCHVRLLAMLHLSWNSYHRSFVQKVPNVTAGLQEFLCTLLKVQREHGGMPLLMKR